MTTNQSNEEVDTEMEIWIRNLSLTGLDLIPVNPSRAEATHRFFVRHVGMLENMVQSLPFTLRTMQWSIRVIPGDVGLGVFVHCRGKQDSPNWSCNATIELRLLNNVPGEEYLLEDLSCWGTLYVSGSSSSALGVVVLLTQTSDTDYTSLLTRQEIERAATKIKARTKPEDMINKIR